MWCARNLNVPIPSPGNHHFVWLQAENAGQEKCLGNLQSKELHYVRSPLLGPIRTGTVNGVAIGGHNVDGDLDVVINQPQDVQSMQEYYCDSCRWKNSNSWDTECNEVATPRGMSDCEFMERIVELAENYQQHNSPPYHANHSNCSMVANSIFHHAGVPLRDRIQCGEFSGLDLSEEELLPAHLFKECNKPVDQTSSTQPTFVPTTPVGSSTGPELPPGIYAQ